MTRPGAVQLRRRRLLLVLLLVGSVAVAARAFQVQVVQAAEWDRRADGQHQERETLPAARGSIYDRNGVPLATNREMLRVSVAPREVRDEARVAARLAESLGLDGAAVRRALDRERRWVVLPGLHEPSVRPGLEGVRGVYLERVLERFHPHGDVAIGLLGRTSPDGRALGGLELELDTLLRGRPGVALVRRDARGAPIPGALFTLEEPRAGHDVYLTLELGLQEIAEQALARAVGQRGATGGDLLFADPRTGELLAAASRRTGGGGHWRAVTDPYEPGSTMKPFVMAALLETGRATLADSLFAENGRLRLGGRTITDVHPHGWITAGEVLRYSSNIGMVKLASRLDPADQYTALRSFGFGTPSGVVYPSESAGRLTRPNAWSGYSQASLAMGYEVAVTPLQMTMAYGALANGGTLLEPRLVREVRAPDGRVVRRWEPRVVRRAASPAVAAAVVEALTDAVEEGTGRRAGLGEFRVAGKTGTARVFEGGRYRSDAFNASFAGFFPARDPQLVFLVKLDHGADYGGAVAAPITRATLAAALAARSSPLDRRAVVAALTLPVLDAGFASAAGAAGGAAGGAAAGRIPPAGGPYVFAMDAGPPRTVSTNGSRLVPEVRGASARDAAAELHAAGFRVAVEGTGRVQEVRPAPGSVAERESVVRVWLGGSR